MMPVIIFPIMIAGKMYDSFDDGAARTAIQISDTDSYAVSNV